MKMSWIFSALTATLWASPAAAQCVAGPNQESQRALQTAFEAQSAIADHLDVASLDRDSRQLSDEANEREPRRGAVTAQATLNYGTSSVRGFSVCDSSSWENAKLANEALGAAASVGSRGVARVEVRVFGVSDSIIQSDLGQYYPDRTADADVQVPGAVGAGHGLWSTRVEVMDEVALTVGRVNTHLVTHSVGWDEEVNDDGSTSLSKSKTAHWGPGSPGRTFVALGVPRLGVSDLVIGEDSVERIHAGSSWIVPRPRDPLFAFRADAGWDGLIRAGIVGADVIPLGRPFDARGLPTFRLRGAAELNSTVLREAAVNARWTYSFEQADLPISGDFFSFEVESGVYGGERLVEAGERAYVPGASARLDMVVPFYAIFRLSMWTGVNRATTINAVPDTVGRPEWGVGFYASYAL